MGSCAQEDSRGDVALIQESSLAREEETRRKKLSRKEKRVEGVGKEKIHAFLHRVLYYTSSVARMPTCAQEHKRGDVAVI